MNDTGNSFSQDDAVHWAGVAQRLQAMWLEFQGEQMAQAMAKAAGSGPQQWLEMGAAAMKRMPLATPEGQQKLFQDGMRLWGAMLGQLGSAASSAAEPPLPDKRFAAPEWNDQPFFQMIHQGYLMIAEQILAAARQVEESEGQANGQLGFAAQALVDALSPANFAVTNPQVIQRALETKGESLIKGLDHLLTDLRRGQLTHTDPDAFKLGENIAVTPGKVIHETALYQLIQYTPVTETVLTVPLVIFPPWINRFYILDLNPAKSFVRWAVEQGVSVFMVSWKSADASMADIVWDDYIAAQIDAVDHVRARLAVPGVHTIGYCVAGTTLAATLAILARRGEADKIASATFFTAQVDFAEAGELQQFIDPDHIAAIEAISPDGYLDGRYMAATFNLLRSNDLIWSYVVRNYLLGEDYPAFDLLHWNGDVTNLPARWHRAYLTDLYQNNRLVQPDALAAMGTPIDLTRIATPVYIQAGREDHIAPPQSVWKLTRHLRGDTSFVLAGSGHIAGVVNPPSSGKYQYWTNPDLSGSLEHFVAGASEHRGSWWPHWLEWLRARDASNIAAGGKRKPGKKGDPVIEDAPGRYVMTR